MPYFQEIRSLKKDLGILQRYFERRRLRRDLARLTGIRPGDLQFYFQAFTHKSALISGQKGQYSNERLEFLGDAVLSLVLGDYLYEKHPDMTEGQLSQLRSRVVNRELFNRLGARMKLDEWMMRIAPYKADVGSSPALLGNAFEALVGAIFLDKGYLQAKRFFINTVLVHHLDIDAVHASDTNYKSRLLEWAQKNAKKIEFPLRHVHKDGHKLKFEVEVLIDGEMFGSARELRKKKAEQEASRQAVERLGI